MSIRVFTKKSFAFKNPDNLKEEVITRPLEFAELPDWVVTDLMYKLATADGDIEVFGAEKKLTRAERIAAAKEAKAAAEAELAADEAENEDGQQQTPAE